MHTYPTTCKEKAARFYFAAMTTISYMCSTTLIAVSLTCAVYLQNVYSRISTRAALLCRPDTTWSMNALHLKHCPQRLVPLNNIWESFMTEYCVPNARMASTRITKSTAIDWWKVESFPMTDFGSFILLGVLWFGACGKCVNFEV